MSDLISRQAAIDAINHICPVDTEYDCTLLDRVDVRCVLSDLPSAQPEIVRCHKCIYWDRDTVRQNSNDAGWWNEAVCKRYSDEIWTSWKDADWYCADAERIDE